MAASTHDLAAWLNALETRHAGPAIRLGLERVEKVLARLAVSTSATVITVGGTNGKGSTCAMLEAILRAGGYRVGLYTSPHLLRFNERIRIDAREATDADLVEALDAVEAVRGDAALTYFEHTTLAAWWLFARAQCEVIVLEVGLGGRLDATNVFDSDCAIVTGVALDHQQWLGDTREAIGYEKAGIFRSGKPAICGDPQPPASLLEHARTLGANLWCAGRDFGYGGDRQQWGYWRYEHPPAQGNLLRRGGLAYPALRGTNQLLNASSALTALEVLRDRIPVPMQAVREGLMHAELPGRFQVLPGRPTLVLDVAHNPQAVGVLAANLGSMGFYPRTAVVLGMLADKAAEEAVAPLRGRVDLWLLASLPGERGREASALAQSLAAAEVGGDIECFESVSAALAAARKWANEDDRIVAFGSFLVVAEAFAVLQAEKSRGCG